MHPPTDLAAYYQVLGLPPDATEQAIKTAYRQLARRYHPDLNPGNRDAEARFKQVAQAYQTLLAALKQSPGANPESYSGQPNQATATPQRSTNGRVRISVQHPPKATAPSISTEDSWFKVRSLKQIDRLIKARKWQQAIALAEKLATRFPNDPNVYHSQALAYHGWARKLLDSKLYEQARIYLKKALHTDSHNRKLWTEIEQDYKRMEQRLKL